MAPNEDEIAPRRAHGGVASDVSGSASRRRSGFATESTPVWDRRDRRSSILVALVSSMRRRWSPTMCTTPVRRVRRIDDGTSEALAIQVKALLAVGLFVTGCAATNNPCEELNKSAPQGVTLSSKPERCTELLKFATTVPLRYRMPFDVWLTTVPAQGTHLISDTVFALAKTSWTATSFGPEPRTPPCAPGVQWSDDEWERSTLSKIASAKPQTLYVSLKVTIAGDRATVEAFQDFNCDGKIGVTRLVGTFHQGRPLMAGGWHLIDGSYAHLDE